MQALPRKDFAYSKEVAEAIRNAAPVVALESTVIAHGLPWPDNLAAATAMEDAVRASGAVPATIAILDGRVTVGLEEGQMRFLAETPSSEIAKVSRRDIAAVIAEKGNGATTVAGTMICAALAGIRCFATGGIGGVHRAGQDTMDISADLRELSRTPVLVVSSGAKAILDLPRTLEVLETEGVPVIGYGTDNLPGFHARNTGLPVDRRLDRPTDVARLARAHWQMGLGGILLCNPVPEAEAIPSGEMESWIVEALKDAERDGITGKEATPYLLARVAEKSGGRSLRANRALLIDNARVAGEVAAALAEPGETA